MEQRVTVKPLGPHTYSAEVVEGDLRRTIEVLITDELIEELQLFEPDEVRLVTESLDFLLEKEKAAGLADPLDLLDVRREYPDYYEEIRSRLDAV